MNKGLLNQQVKELRWSKESVEIVYNAANVVQFCLQQLLLDDAAAFSSYIEIQLEAQRMFGDIQKMIERLLETNLDVCGESAKNRIVPKLEQAKDGTQNYLNKIREKEKKREEIAQCEETLQTIEGDTARLEKELEARKEQIRVLTKLREELSRHNMQQMEKDLKELEEKLKREKELRSREEEKEKRLEEQLQLLKDGIMTDWAEIEKQCGQIKQKSADILNKKKESESQKRERLQRLEQRECEYMECQDAFVDISLGTKKHLDENERITGQMSCIQTVSDIWRGQLDELRNSLSKKLSEFEELHVFIKEQMDLAAYKKAAGKEHA